MNATIDINFQGGNIFIEDINDYKITLTKDLRNSTGDWFYWSFRVQFNAIGLYNFHFTNGYACGTRGPAVSYDQGLTWEWLGADCVSGDLRDTFNYYFDGKRGNSVIFCMGMQYNKMHLDAFIKQNEKSPYFSTDILTRSRKNREVIKLHIEDKSDNSPKKYIFLVSRNHCCEMMATYAMEGILNAALQDDELGRELRKRYIIDAVPFADTDGVIDGDQGKLRSPHDHNRDYVTRPIYPEVAAIQQLLKTKDIFFMLDMHCPWLFRESNETIFFPGPFNKEYEKRMLAFSQILEKNSPPEAPHYTKDNVLFGTSWNSDKNWTNGLTCGEWGRRQNAFFSNCIEIAYANAGDVTLTTDSARKLGRALAVSIIEFDNTYAS